MGGISLEELERRENNRGKPVDALPEGAYRYREYGVERIVQMDMDVVRETAAESMREWQEIAERGERERFTELAKPLKSPRKPSKPTGKKKKCRTQQPRRSSMHPPMS